VKEYDIIIIGAGPAGLAAGLYAARARRSTLLFDLGQAMQTQAEKYGMETLYTTVQAIEPGEGGHTIKTEEGDFLAKAVIVTAGADYNRLEVPGEHRLTGYGVSYCGTCDAAFFKDMEVIVVGGGDAAMDEGLFISRYASKVKVVHRRDTLRASTILQERAFANDKIEFIWNTVVESIDGEKEVTSAHLKNVVTGEEYDMPISAVFVFIGQTPNTSFVKGLLDLDPGGHVIVNDWMETNVPGIFAAGDVRNNAARQVVTSAGDGATAAIRADHYISNHYS
jgi:thioredoxin reductase (NADPH)